MPRRPSLTAQYGTVISPPRGPDGLSLGGIAGDEPVGDVELHGAARRRHRYSQHRRSPRPRQRRRHHAPPLRRPGLRGRPPRESATLPSSLRRQPPPSGRMLATSGRSSGIPTGCWTGRCRTGQAGSAMGRPGWPLWPPHSGTSSSQIGSSPSLAGPRWSMIRTSSNWSSSSDHRRTQM